MRAGVLSDSEIIKLLNKHYVNVFVRVPDLREIQKKTKDESISKFARTVSTAFEEAVAQGAGRSVNSFVLSPQLELIGHFPYKLRPNDAETYLTFLKDALTKNK